MYFIERSPSAAKKAIYYTQFGQAKNPNPLSGCRLSITSKCALPFPYGLIASMSLIGPSRHFVALRNLVAIGA
jgi:hypothetical protein